MTLLSILGHPYMVLGVLPLVMLAMALLVWALFSDRSLAASAWLGMGSVASAALAISLLVSVLYKPEDEWRSMDTVPRDGTVVLVAEERYSRIVIRAAYYGHLMKFGETHVNTWWFFEPNGGAQYTSNGTFRLLYWKPMPVPPPVQPGVVAVASNS